MLFLNSAILSLACLARIVSAAPAHIPRASTCTNGTAVKPDMYNLYPQQPNRTSTAVSDWHLETFSNKSQIEQAAVFKNIPAGATECSLQWIQADRTERTFLVDGSDALVTVRALSGFPSDSVSYTSVKEYDTSGSDDETAVELTGWDTLGKWTHIGGGIDCAEEIRLYLFLQDADGDTKFLLEQDENNGLVIEYTC